MFILIILCVLFLFWYFIENFRFWQKHKVYSVFTNFSYFKTFFTRNQSFFELSKSLYLENEPKRRYYGTYIGLKPTLVVCDFDLIQQVLIKDYEHFNGHIDFINSQYANSPLQLSIFEARGKTWRNLRTAFTPAFSSSKMKNMHQLMQPISQQFVEKLDELNGEDQFKEVDVTSLFVIYLNDILTNCALGTHTNCFKDKDNLCLKYGKQLMYPNLWTWIKGGIMFVAPKLAQTFKLNVISYHIVIFFVNFVKQTVEQRKISGIERPDFINMLLQKNLEFSKKSAVPLTEEMIAVQAGTFYTAGVVTSQTILNALTYELAKQPKIQKKLQQEINETVAKCGSATIPYDHLVKMKYLDQVVNEALRKWPPAYLIGRQCTKSYVIKPKLPNEEEVIIEEECLMNVPIVGLHYNPKYFPNPEVFDPERFSSTVPKYFMPFGIGPRSCAGKRFAMLQIKTVVCSFLQNYSIAETQNTNFVLANSYTTELNKNLLIVTKKKIK